MSSTYVYRFSTRLAAAPVRAQLFRPTASIAQTRSIRRTYAQTTPSPDPKNPKASPGSDSTQEGAVKSSRATDDPKTTEHGGSTAQPVSGKGDQVGASEEGDTGMKKGDASTPASEKRAAVEEEGKKPLDAADK